MTATHAAKFSLLRPIFSIFFDHDNAEGYAAKVERFIATLIIVSVFAVMLEHIPELYDPNKWEFELFDIVSVGIFTVEYLLRLATAPLHPDYAGKRFARIRYFFSFYALVDLVAIAPFYFARVVDVDVEMLRVLRILRLARMFKLSRQLVPAWQEFQTLNQGRSLRAKLYALLEPTGHSGRLHFYVDNFIVFWIALSICCVVLETVDTIHAIFHVQFAWIDMMSFSIFTLEYAARLYAAPENPLYQKFKMPRWQHMRTGQAVIDLLTILPFILESFLTQHLDLRFLRTFRLMRMLKLTRYTSATQTLLRVLEREWQVIFASVFVMMLLVVLTASVGYMFEHPVQPDKFENIPQSIYWAVITLASVGYGDISPITPMGRALTVVLALVGIGIFAIPAGLLASAFTDQLRIDRESFKNQIVRAFEDGEMDGKERESIIAEAERLHLAQEEYEQLIEDARREYNEKAAAQELNFGQLMLDAKAHPDLAAEQFRILVAQLHLMMRAIGPEVMTEQLKQHPLEPRMAQQVLTALAEHDANHAR